MSAHWPRSLNPQIFVATLVLTACSGDDASSGTDTASTTSVDTTTTAGGTEGTATAGETDATTSGSASDTATGGTTTTAGTTTAGTTSAGTTSEGTTSEVTTSEGTSEGSTEGTTEGVTEGTTDDTTEGNTTEPDCVPSEEICNDADDDCNGIIDDVDVGMDGICDCLSIGIFGTQGANPSAEFQQWLEAQGTEVERIQTAGNVPLDEATLLKYDIVILDRLVRNYNPQEAALTAKWVESGGGLMSMTGYSGAVSDRDRPNSLIQPMGLAYNMSKGFFSGPITNFAAHPITEGLTSITFAGGLYIDITPDGIGDNKTIMTLPQGPVGVAQERLGGRLFVFGDEWVTFDSEWKNQPEIKKFWVQTLAFLGPQDSCVVPQ
ncbi:MAG: hypothetical protein IPK80_33425 [Nannocystis sp.]|nr:hypothetical protein [Nannocystis sp.]